mgnify:CR=1 FL=1
MPTITPVYPTGGDAFVHPRSYFIFNVTEPEGTVLDQSALDVYMHIGTQIDPPYPVSPDHYGTTIPKNQLTALGTLADGDFERVMEVVKQHFKPEFINRLDEIILFNRLSKKDMFGIVKTQTILYRFIIYRPQHKLLKI